MFRFFCFIIACVAFINPIIKNNWTTRFFSTTTTILNHRLYMRVMCWMNEWKKCLYQTSVHHHQINSNKNNNKCKMKCRLNECGVIDRHTMVIKQKKKHWILNLCVWIIIIIIIIVFGVQIKNHDYHLINQSMFRFRSEFPIHHCIAINQNDQEKKKNFVDQSIHQY